MRSRLIGLLAAALLASACSAPATPSANAVQTAIAQTAQAAPTSTAVPPTAMPPTVAPTLTAAPTATPIPPTATALPTNTAVPPTATPQPTSTPMPTATPDLRGTLTADEQAYWFVLADGVEGIKTLDISGDSVIEKLTSGFTDDQVVIRKAINSVLMVALARLRALKPSARFSAVHNSAVKMLTDGLLASEAMVGSIANRSAGQVPVAVEFAEQHVIDLQVYEAELAKLSSTLVIPPIAPTPALLLTNPPAVGTQTALMVRATATASMRAVLAAEIADYKPIASKELASYADRHALEKVKVTGRVFNIVKGADDIQMYFAGTYDPVYVSFREKLSGIYENDTVTIYGTVSPEGFQCFKNANNAEVCQPHLMNAFTAPGIAPASGAPVASGEATAAPKPVVSSGPACPAGNVCITSPASGLTVSRGQNVRFTGSANAPAFLRYQFRARDANGSAWGHIADFTTPVTNGKLMDFFTGSVPAGTYVIQLQVVESNGNIVGPKAEVVLTIE